MSGSFAVLVLAVLGLLLWLVYMGTPFAGKSAGKKEVTDWSFLKSTRFWLLTGLLFCQNAAEQSVTGWMVTYFKGSGIIAGALAAYTVTVMWGATSWHVCSSPSCSPSSSPARPWWSWA